MRKLTTTFLTLGLAIACNPTAVSQDHDTQSTLLNDDRCEVVSGDYGAPLASLHVISECQGMDDWTVILHEYANSTEVEFRYLDGPSSGTLPFMSFGPNGRPGESVDWVYDNERVLGAIIGYRDMPPPGQMDGTYNLYSIALKPGLEPTACLVARVEFGKKRGVPHAAELATHLFANDWKCGEDEMMEFAPEATDPNSLADLVTDAARNAGKLPQEQE
ncbi:MAG: hypothetical protein CMK07_10100 [Ponticaulis sp.]|nr:hypothetical protein [Ponticaulis sp.]